MLNRRKGQLNNDRLFMIFCLKNASFSVLYEFGLHLFWDNGFVLVSVITYLKKMKYKNKISILGVFQNFRILVFLTKNKWVDLTFIFEYILIFSDILGPTCLFVTCYWLKMVPKVSNNSKFTKEQVTILDHRWRASSFQ